MTGNTNSAGPAPKFPVYLLPSFSIPFRLRRQSSLTPGSYGSPPAESNLPSLGSSPTDSTISSPVGSPATSSYFSSRFSFSKDWRRASVEPLDISKLSRTSPDTIRCSTCSTDLAFTSQIVSKGFTGRYGRAYLVSSPDHAVTGKSDTNLVNIKVGKQETRLLVTGSHVVADITCAICHAKVGWKYVDAKEEAQKYKVGKFILETARTMDHRSWEDVEVSELSAMEAQHDSDIEGDEPVIFDSEDDDECEDIFAGTWDADAVAKRRARKVHRRPKQVV
ncbi:yippee zinc-binding/DNA-binding /Mis18, centromere assembly-domain-containing protein [Truncatella angustata]|uniref:Yippee zinc-binding/DNA-binding /Mis18, centromere assembly-domain-containing protein n=1 Tax=Truncatella angustata TaxID=152316 RepID=A0A9P8UMW1_9PEZI|nr:yippee zinc-binding/DNA-binding /Mis18, centromere assembly-domain-containing protein [Truncatella angustata]KAH6655604.1 yippee zinc-binding/DNA-binding /Mis18, centromere assembly-domain-containing protein [Truncatella angustata]KAH8197797.1 hypothetical protein TruAng_008044 [Truncatella angustata]